MGIADRGEETVSEILRRVKEEGIRKRGLLDQQEFQQIVESVMGAAAVSAPAAS
jgi:hypothetical protein